MIIAPVFVFLALGGALTGFMSGGERVQSCTTERLQKCFDKFRFIFNDSILAFPVEPYQIRRSARFLEKARTCVHKWNERCFYSKIKLIKPEIIEGIIEMADTFGHNADAYANYSACFHQVATENCWDSFVDARDFGNSIKDNATITFLNEFCCYHQAFVKCQEHGIQTICEQGEQAYQKYPAHIDFLMKMILGSDCYSLNSSCFISSETVKKEGDIELMEWIPNGDINSAMEPTLYLVKLLLIPTIMIIFI